MWLFYVIIDEKDQLKYANTNSVNMNAKIHNYNSLLIFSINVHILTYTNKFILNTQY